MGARALFVAAGPNEAIVLKVRALMKERKLSQVQVGQELGPRFLRGTKSVQEASRAGML